MPKGVLVTDKMLQACGYAATTLADVSRGDVLYLWEPIYHIAGCEVLIVALLEARHLGARRALQRVALLERRARLRRHAHPFLRRRAADCCSRSRPAPGDRDHGARIAWGGGCPISIWTKFQDRFGVRIRECYGMTEASSFTTLNTDEKLGSIGKPLPYFEVRIADDDGRFLGPGQRGEIWVQGEGAGRDHDRRISPTRTRPRRRCRTAGCAPATSAMPTTRASSISPAARRTACAAAARTSRPGRWSAC